MSRSSVSEEDEPLMNVTPNGEPSHNGSGPLNWLGLAAHPAIIVHAAAGTALHDCTAAVLLRQFR